MRSRYSWSPSWIAGDSRDVKIRKRSPIDPAPSRTLAALVAVALAGLPPSVPDLLAAPPSPTPFLQDTTRAEQDTTRAERLVDPQGTPQDTTAADSLAEPEVPFPDPDSLMRQLMERPGYRPVLYRGDTLRFDTDEQRIYINRRAHIERVIENENLYAADSVVFDRQSQFITAFGEAKLINANGEEVDSEEGPVFYHTGTKIGTFVGGRTRWEVWNVEGDFTLEGSDTLWVEAGHFTSCDLPEPHYRFESDKIKLVLGHIVVAWPVRVYFGDVPVFWFPFMAQDIRRGRHSGILTLQFGVNDIIRQSANYKRHISNVGYYWAISDYMDAQFSLDWWSDTWTRFDGFYRYRWRQKFLTGRIGSSYFLLPDGGRELSLAWNHSQKFGERADLRASVSFVSSQQFQRENEFNPERLVQQLRSDVSYSRRFDWGTLNLGAQRVQPLSNPDSFPQPTTMTLPSFSLTLKPIVITPSPSPIDKSWYHGLTWTGSTNLTRSTSETPGRPGQSTLNSGLTSNLSLGNLRWNSSGTFRETVTDTLVLGEKERRGDVSWRTSLGYQQRLIGSTTLTPALNLDGQLRRTNQTDLRFVAAPTRVSVSAGLNSDIYGFFPGVGPVERIRHKISPAINWRYSPAVTPSLRAQEVFGVDSLRENHVITLGLQQTFEAKLKPRNELQDSAEAGPDSLEARGPDEGRKITLLAIRTSSLTYDVVTGKVTTGSISNSVSSDLLRGLTLRFTHDLFEEGETGRRFAPFLTQLNLGFSLGERTFEGLVGGPDDVRSGRGIVPQAEEFSEQELEELREGELPEREDRSRGARQPWTLSVDYSLLRTRPRPGEDPPSNRQSIRANFGFQPTENWTVTWRTQYDLEGGEFVDHALSLRRSLHRWSATFRFLKASNGNFVFDFRVNLNDLRDVKFDYRQETRG